uniref:40S ribosomal protein S15a n=1 Tax=Eptatretus burgeri TaxID=7764 RepID=A0A8C4Q539_EPTBU
MRRDPSSTRTASRLRIVSLSVNERVVVNLTGRLSKCGVISPRFDVQLKDLEKWQRNILPSGQFGIQRRRGLINHQRSRGFHVRCSSCTCVPLIM